MADAERSPLNPPLAELLPRWVAEQRWYAGKGRLPALRRVGGLRYQDPAGEVGIETHFLVDESGREPTVYQVPLTYRHARLPGAEHALVAVTEHRSLGTRYIYDGPHDPRFTTELMRSILSEQTVTSEGAPGTGRAVGHRQPGASGELTLGPAKVLTGEQSNTSVIIETTQPDGRPFPVICKLFRVIHHGDNPDVVVQGALASAGSPLVPSPVGHVSGEWPDGRTPGGVCHGHLAFAQEFLPGVEDAWRVALAAVAAGEDFSERARTLGRATAEVHATLASALPTEEPTRATIDSLLAGMRVRHAAAASEVPALVEFDAAIREVIARAAAAPWPTLQRIHGDFHLGQVLDVPGRGWVLLDFEGEPLRPLAERSLPDLPLRDVAGMLRSFDYAAGSWEQAHPGRSARPWADAARSAYLQGYAEAAEHDPRAQGDLLAALELDKALYEVVYEAGNRPTWLTIPVTAIARLSNGARRYPA